MTTIGKNTTITWAGHGTFHLTTPEGRGVLIDAWLDGNPACPDGLKASLRQNLAVVLLTHGHFDHIADLVQLAQQTGATVVCQYDLVSYLEAKGIPGSQLVGFNKGGTVSVADMKVTMTNAHHSSSITENGQIIGLGTACGFVIRMSNGFTIYHTGDTSATMDMQIVRDLYAPELTILPIGDHFTMDPRQAAYALKLIGAQYAIPGHYGTFPILSGTPEALVAAGKEFGVTTEVIALKPGESVS
ncbi:MAG: metal-dependent hydrolase [Oscillochloris sp.]|nr:metal-dependent hydrolase [Oscillochloris sp.]